MEQLFKAIASYLALLLEGIAVILVARGGIEAALGAARSGWRLFGTAGSFRRDKDVFLHFAAWLVLGLEFELAADIIRTAIAPTWQDLGKLGTVAAIRTGLNYFLERDLDKYAPLTAEAPAAPTSSSIATTSSSVLLPTATHATSPA